MLASYKRQQDSTPRYQQSADEARTALQEQKDALERSRIQNLLEQCADTREVRMRYLVAFMAREDHINELRQWESDHCKHVDNSVAVIRTVQDSNGEYHTVEGRDRGVDYTCNAALPAEIKGRSAFSMTPGAFPEDAKRCKDLDIAASPIASKFWSDQQ